MTNIQRFIDAHKDNFHTALKELRDGYKQSHWMWYIFPQIQGLGCSPTAEYYAIQNLDEAREYMSNQILSGHMLVSCNALLVLETSNASETLGYPDNLKLKSSMTLFSISNPEIDVFQKVLDKFFDGEKDEKTIEILEKLEEYEK